MVGLGTRSAIERAESGNSRPKAARASALPDSAARRGGSGFPGVITEHAVDLLLDFQRRGTPGILNLRQTRRQIVRGALPAYQDELVEGPGAGVWVHGLFGVLGQGVHQAECVDGGGRSRRSVRMARVGEQALVDPLLWRQALEGEDAAPVRAAMSVPDGGVSGVRMVRDGGVKVVVIAFGGVHWL